MILLKKNIEKYNLLVISLDKEINETKIKLKNDYSALLKLETEILSTNEGLNSLKEYDKILSEINELEQIICNENKSFIQFSTELYNNMEILSTVKEKDQLELELKILKNKNPLLQKRQNIKNNIKELDEIMAINSKKRNRLIKKLGKNYIEYEEY